MDTNTVTPDREVSELYISKINSLIAAGRESLIGSVVAEYDRSGQAPSKSIAKAA